MSLLIHHLLLVPLCVCELCGLSVFCYVVLVSFLVLKSSSWGRKSWLIYLNCQYCCHVVVRDLCLFFSGWSKVCNCVIFWPYSLLLFYFMTCVCPSSIIVSLNDISS